MALTCTVGGAQGTFETGFAREVAGVLDSAFGGESDWERISPRQFGALLSTSWAVFRRKAVAELGDSAVPNLLAMSVDGRGVYLPANVQAVSLPMSAGGPLRCASLPGLRRELSEFAGGAARELPLDDVGLNDILRAAPPIPTTALSPMRPRCSRSPVSPWPPTKQSGATARSGSWVNDGSGRG